MKKCCGLFTNIAPLYSRPLWYELSQSKNVDYVFYSSRNSYSGIKTIDPHESKHLNADGKLDWFFLKNILVKNSVFYQSGIISRCIKTNFDAYILYGEMHCLSNWVAALICKWRKKPVLFWGHGIYGNEKSIKKIIRNLYNKLADFHLVYGNRSKGLMIESGFNPQRIYVVYNSLDFNLHKKLYEESNMDELSKLKIKLFPNSSELPVVIFIGRLTKEKKISLLLEAICLSRERGNNYNCLIVGDGEEKSRLQKLALSLGISDSVCFYGSCYDENMNGNLIMLSECCISPGNIGLTAIHSLSFGTPVITHRNMLNQGPEAEAVIQGKTGFLFKENDAKNLSEAVDELIINRKKTFMRKNCIDQVRDFWNPKRQAAVFDEAVLNSMNKKYV